MSDKQIAEKIVDSEIMPLYDTISSLQAENERLRKALEPFVKMRLAQPERDDVIAYLGMNRSTSILNGDIRRARAALRAREEGKS
jgi:tetrahydromethanopterin S-methyltransferase subunit B